MVKRARKTRSDRCERLRQELIRINDQINEVLDDLSQFDIPASVRKRLEQLLKRLQARRTGILRELAACETMEARRSRIAAKGRTGASKRRKFGS
jgi:hypothetical protein